MRGEAEILHDLQGLADCQGSVRLLNNYQGLPVIQPAEVKWVAESQVCLEVHPHQAVCMYRDQNTTLLADCFQQPVRAGVVRLDVLNNLAILVSFQFENSSIGKRMTQRLHPKPALEAVITDGAQSFPCRLVDISLNGAGGVVLNKDVNDRAFFAKGRHVYLDVNLPLHNRPVRLQAQLVGLTVFNEPPVHRFGLALITRGAAQDLLKNYLDLRQEQTLQEMEQEYELLCRKQGTA